MSQQPDPADQLIQHSKQGTGSWLKSDTVLNFYGKDDFEESGMGDFFRSHGVPVYTIKNDGTPRFFAQLKHVFTLIFGK